MIPLNDRAAVSKTLQRLGEAWRERRYDDLRSLLDEHVVMVLPGFGGRLEGRAALVESYREFMERSILKRYVEAAPAIDLFHDTAIATFGWEMEWNTHGVDNTAAGHELWIFTRGTDRNDSVQWRAVWRMMILSSAA
jgi:hypothetical protein